MYDTHIKKARAAGLITGAYHFNWSPLSVISQVDTFIRNAGDVDLYALDVEDNVNKETGTRTEAFNQAQAREFIRLFKLKTGKKIGLYMSESGFYTDVGQDWNWVAHWDREPRIHWDLWQFGPYKGEDGNRFNGTVAQLRQLGGSGPMGTAINSTSRVVKSTHARLLRAGVVLYRDTNGTPLTTLSRDMTVDDFGYPVGESGWGVVGITSAKFDTDDENERGLALIRTNATGVGDVRPKTQAELFQTADSFSDMGVSATEVAEAIREATREADAALAILTDQQAALLAEFEAYKTSEATRVQDAITVDRTKARPGVVYED
jgi:hypothetical protein